MNLATKVHIMNVMLASYTVYDVCSHELILAGIHLCVCAWLLVMQNTMPAHHSDPRFAWGLCRAMLDRVSVDGNGGAGGSGAELGRRLESCRGKWEALYHAAGQDVPDPWLGPSNPLKLPGVDWIGIEWV